LAEALAQLDGHNPGVAFQRRQLALGEVGGEDRLADRGSPPHPRWYVTGLGDLDDRGHLLMVVGLGRVGSARPASRVGPALLKNDSGLVALWAS